MASKRRRDNHTADALLVEVYEDLANENEEIRLRAAHTLLSRFALPSTSSPQSTRTILQRLFRGLCSGRKAARVGFSTALTEFLAQIFEYPAEERELSYHDILDILVKQTVTHGSTSGQDERDHYFGRLFGAEGIVKSCVLFKHKASLPSWRDLLHFVSDLAIKKPWLKQECGWLFFVSIGYIQSTTAGPEFAAALIESMKSYNLLRTPEGVAAWLEVKSCCPQAPLPNGVWKCHDPLCEEETASLAEVMKNTGVKQQSEPNEPVASQGAATWSQHLHFSWHVVLRELYIPADPDAKASTRRMSFATFWTNVVDKSLFVPGGSPERKHWGFLLLAKAVTTVPLQFLPGVFTENTVLILVNHLKLDERYLHRSAKKVIQALQTRADREPVIISHVMQGLVLGPSGLYNFDTTTKTKTIAKLMTAADLETYHDLVTAFRNAIEQPQVVDEKKADMKRKAFANMLVSVFSRTLAMTTEANKDPISVAEGVLGVLMTVAYAEKSHISDGRTFKPPPSHDCRLYLRSRARTCLDQSLQYRMAQLPLLRRSIGTLKSIQKQENSNQPTIEFDTETQGIIDIAWRRLRKISKSNDRRDDLSTQASSAHVLEILYSLAILQLYDGDTDAPTILQDLNAYQHSCRRGSAQPHDAGQPESIIEIILSFSSKHSRFFHQSGLLAFRAFTSQVSRPGLQSFVRVLATKEGSTRTQDIFDVDDSGRGLMEDGNQQEDHSSSADASSPESYDSDVQQLSEKSSSSDEEQDHQSQEDPSELEAFEAKLAAALGTYSGHDDLDEKGAEGSDKDIYEEDMDKEEMEALDEKLAEVFRATKSTTNKKQERKDTREAIINFKRRVLDLVDVYLKQEQLNPLALDLVLPLITTAKTTNIKQISERAYGILQGFCSRCKGPNVPVITGSAIDTSEVLRYLKSVHEEAGLDNARAHTAACSRASILLVKVLVKADFDVREIIDVYAETRTKQLLDKNCKVPPAFFTEWNNWCTSARDQLAR